MIQHQSAQWDSLLLTRLDFLKPCTKETVRKKQCLQKDRHDSSAADQSFSVDDIIYLRSTVGGDHRWIPALVVRETGLALHVVRERDADTAHRRHGDQLRARTTAESNTVITDAQIEQ